MNAQPDCIDCGTPVADPPDHEGFLDCGECGAAFIPGVAIPDEAVRRAYWGES